MNKMYSEVNVTWSTIENLYEYAKTKWTMDGNGIPRFVFLNQNGDKIKC